MEFVVLHYPVSPLIGLYILLHQNSNISTLLIGRKKGLGEEGLIWLCMLIILWQRNDWTGLTSLTSQRMETCAIQALSARLSGQKQWDFVGADEAP